MLNDVKQIRFKHCWWGLFIKIFRKFLAISSLTKVFVSFFLEAQVVSCEFLKKFFFVSNTGFK